jgi:nicotinate-nucleotide adenylyltransferase
MTYSRVGIFAGTFDPVHHGHITFAKAAITACQLDKVVLLPEASPRGKTGVTSIEHRLAMLRAATAGNDKLEVLHLPDHQFTVAKTLPELQKRYAGARLVMLLGSDVAAYLHAWPDVEKLLEQTDFAIGFRENTEPLRDIEATIIPTEHSHVAASHVRNGQSDDIDPAVRSYIKKHKLYQV